jgi:hypothetical protein
LPGLQILDMLEACEPSKLCSLLISGGKKPTVVRLLEVFPSGRQRASL